LCYPREEIENLNWKWTEISEGIADRKGEMGKIWGRGSRGFELSVVSDVRHAIV
jgi:hypothetical protein